MKVQDYANAISGAKAKNVNISILEGVTGVRNAYHLREVLQTIAGCSNTDPSAMRVRHFFPIFDGMDREPERYPGNVVCKPVIDAAFVAAEGKAADQATVQTRIDKPRPALTQHVEEKYRDYLDEFVAHIVHAAKDGHIPNSIEEVLEAQKGKKAAEYARGFENGCENLLWKSFQKTEAYQNIKDPRNISNVDKKHVVRYLRYTVKVSDLLKVAVPWYAFGLPPEEVANRVNQVVNRTACISETDYSRYDGTLALFLRECELRVYSALFREEDRAVLNELFNETLFADFKTRYGVHYNNGTGRCSGSACTSCGNTIINAYANYAALRDMGKLSSEAWAGLGLYGGDDGLTYHPDPQQAEATMAALGLKFKSEVREPGEKVGFLGRIYLDPWTHNRSHHDILRAASKLHFTAKRAENVSAETAAWRKAVSLFVTDNQTPLLGEWARTVLKFVPNGKWEHDWWLCSLGIDFDSTKITTSASIIAQYDGHPIFPGPLPEERELIIRDFISCSSSPIDLKDYKRYLRVLKKSTKLDRFPNALWREEAVAVKDYPVWVDDAVIGPPAGKGEKSPCFDWLRGDCKRGGKCKYYHDPTKNGVTEICRDFNMGKCKRTRCKFRHVTATSSCSTATKPSAVVTATLSDKARGKMKESNS
jgi:hypothetical protein